MADVNILSFSEATDPRTGYVYIVIGGTDYKISYENFASIINAGIPTISKDTAKSASYTKTIPANSLLQRIDIKRTSGTPVIKVGTTLAGDEVMLSQTVSTFSINEVPEMFGTLTTLYITISGGTVNINFVYHENYF